MRAERAMKRLIEPMTSPAARRSMISARDGAVGMLAGVASRLDMPRSDPAFVVIGAQKGGTTFLFQELLRHSRIKPALTKELHYFDDNYRRGHDWYRGHFVNRDDDAVMGEASPSYLFHPHAPFRLASDLPSTKVIAVLRDPVARAFSHWRHERRLGYEPIDRFEDALAAEQERTASDLATMIEDPTHVSFAWRHFTYRARGCYVDQVDRWVAACGAERVLVLESSDLYRNPTETLQVVHRFLGVDPEVPTTIGSNDMAAGGSESLDPAVAQELRDYFAPWNRRLVERFGIGRQW